ncbi:MAG: GNAT family N-acetyltransferase [Cellulosilyticaceae bacterium]
MYEYFRGYVIREGNEGIPVDKLRSLYVQTGWVSPTMSSWQNEKFEVALKNSAWAFTVWDKEKLIAMVRVVSDKVMVASIQDLIVREEYRQKGIGTKLISLCMQKMPHGCWSARVNPDIYHIYEEHGFEIDEQNEKTTLIYNGFEKAREDGNR